MTSAIESIQRALKQDNPQGGTSFEHLGYSRLQGAGKGVQLSVLLALGFKPLNWPFTHLVARICPSLGMVFTTDN